MALVAKQAWRILQNPNALWVKLLKSLYFPKTSFMLSKKGWRPSWIWDSLCKAKGILSLGCFKAIGNGESTFISKDPWLPFYPHMSIPIDTGPFETASDWILDNPRRWDIPTKSMYCNQYQLEMIHQIPIGPANLEDEWKWKFNKEGHYTVRTAYHAFRASRSALMGSYNRQEKDDLWSEKSNSLSGVAALTL
ncbi:Uncharacterized mitochondrial protein AtMg00310 [Linum perenne]